MADRSFYQGWVEILPDFSKFNQQVNSHATSALGSAGTAGGDSFKRGFTGSVFSGSFLGTFAANIATTLASAVGRGIRSGVDYASQATNLAGDLGESVNAIQVAFGAANEEVLELSATAPQRLNLTRVAFNNLATRFSAFAGTIAGKGGNVASVVDKITERGADFASVFNLDATEALQLFQSGLAGETEPLRRFGIDLSAATVAQFAYANGIAESGKELTEAEKIQARYGALLEQTAKTEGDLANTRGSLANQQRELNTALEEAQTKFGEALLPTVTELVSFTNEDLLPILEEALAEAGPALEDAIRDSLPEIKELLETAAEYLPDAIKLGIEGLANDAELLSDIGKILQGDFSPITEANEDGIFPVKADSPFGKLFVDNDNFYLEGQNFGISAGQAIANGLSEGLKNGRPEATAEGNRFRNELIATIGKDAPLALLPAGNALADGLAAGIYNDRSLLKVRTAAKGIADEAVSTIRRNLQIQSPSKVAMQDGAFLAEGFALGISSGVQSVASAADEMSRAAMPTVGPGSSALAGGVGGVRDITLVTQDPWVAAQMLKQELGGKLAGF